VNLEDPVPEEPVNTKKNTPKPDKKEVKPEQKPVAPPAPAEPKAEEVEATLEETSLDLNPSPVQPVEPPKYNLWEKMSPSARRKKQITTMESGSREVLSLVRSLRENMDQQVLAQKSLLKHVPEAAESVRKLAEYTGRHTELLELMHNQLEAGQENARNMSETVSRFNDTMVSMDKTTQLLLERAQRSEERLYKMLRRSQRRLALLMLLIMLLVGGGFFGLHYALYPERTETWLTDRGILTAPQTLVVPVQVPESEQEAPVEPELPPPPAEPAPIPEPELSEEPEEPEAPEPPPADEPTPTDPPDESNGSDESDDLPTQEDDESNGSDESDVPPTEAPEPEASTEESPEESE
jgi:hypothetical protein